MFPFHLSCQIYCYRGVHNVLYYFSMYRIFSDFFQKNILLKYVWLTMFQVHSKVIQLYKYTYIIF